MSRKNKFADNDKVFNGTDTPCAKPRCISAHDK